MRVFAECEELPCSAEHVRLVFFSRPDRSRYADNHRLEMETGGLRLEWPGPRYEPPEYTVDDETERIEVRVSFEDFRALAFADTLEGRLGSTVWELPYDERASLRSMIRQLE
jgi:hypothetical protein